MFIDIHCHLLPGVDDGARTLEDSLAMARMAVADGVRLIACTPHVNPGLYNYDAAFVAAAVENLRKELKAREIDLFLLPGADVHLVADLPARLEDGRAPRLGRSHYFLLEPPHDLCPPRLDRQIERILAAGYRPIITHPERLRWIDNQFPLLNDIHRMGCLFQITAGAITGRFGTRVKAHAERFIRAGQCDVVASDAHDPSNRTTILSRARDAVAGMVGLEVADRMVRETPHAILSDAADISRGSAPRARER